MYSVTLMDHFTHPRNVGALDAPDLVGQAGEPGSGPFMVLHLATDGGRITAARFQTYGCGPAIAAGSLLTELIVSRTRGECAGLTVDDLVRGLGGMPEEKVYCAQLAIDALAGALAKWEPGQGERLRPGDPAASV